MKTLLILLLSCLSIQAAQVGIQWTCPGVNVTKFTVYRLVNNTRVKLFDVSGDQRKAYPSLPVNTWITLVVTASNGTIESPASNQLTRFMIRQY